MWRICRKSIFPRWHVNRQNPADNKNQAPTCSKVLIISPLNEKKKYSHHNHQEKKQHANKQDKRCWDDPQFQFNSCSNLLEMAGWVGTAAVLCINVHVKHMKTILDYDRPNSCLFSRNVLAMPKQPISIRENPVVQFSSAIKSVISKESTSSRESSSSGESSSSRESNSSILTLVPQKEFHAEKDQVSNDTDILSDILNLMDQYIASSHNSIGIASLNRNDKKAFRCFQSAAHHGSSQAFYNLGLCYELGKGTRINLQRAAFCYRKAARQGHGLASFNLAMYFMKGMGGLPVDADTAKLLLVEAAKKGVPEAQIYLGIELFEKKKWLDAVAIFKDLAKENVPDAQYYLGLCYENGWGVKRDLVVAAELFSKSAAEGNHKATLKIKNYYDERTNNKEEPKIKPPVLEKSRKNCLHVSTSVPELSASVKVSDQVSTKSLIPSYLNLMIPFFIIRNDFSKPKSSFYVGDDNDTKECSNNFMPSPLIPQILPVETWQ